MLLTLPLTVPSPSNTKLPLAAALLMTLPKLPSSLTLTVPPLPAKSVCPVIVFVLIVPTPPNAALPAILPVNVPEFTRTFPVTPFGALTIAALLTLKVWAYEATGKYYRSH